MRLVVVAVRDTKGELFSQPMFFQSKGQAIRSFVDAIHDKGTVFAKHPEDYNLFDLGEFDDVEGTLVARASGPVVLCQGVLVHIPEVTA